MADLSKIFERAVGCHQSGQFAEAERLYRKVVRARPDHFEAQYLFALLYFQQNRNTDAVTAIGAALRVKPDWVEALLLQGLIRHRSGRGAEALESFDRAIAIRPGSLEALISRGNALQELARYQEA